MSISGGKSSDEGFLHFLLKHYTAHHAPAICAPANLGVQTFVVQIRTVVERFLFESYDVLVSEVSSPNQKFDIKKL